MSWVLLIAACTSSEPLLEAPLPAARFVDPPDAWTVGVAGDGLGAAVTVVGDVDADGFDDLIATSPDAEMPGAQADFGRVDLFLGGASGPGPSPVLSADQRGVYPFSLPMRAAVVGDMSGLGELVVGVAAPNFLGGSVWAFTVTSGQLTRESQYTGGYGSLRFGTAIAGIDADGNGIVDLLGGDPWRDFSFWREGSIIAYAEPYAEVWEALGGAPDVELGDALAVLDLDADGFDDLVAGAPGASELWVFTGSAAGLPTTPAGVVSGTGRLGDALATADVDGDGDRDLIAGAPSGDGALSVWLGGTLPGATPDQALLSPMPYAELGEEVVAPGDVDADGYDDVLVLAPAWDGVGAWVLYMGGPAGLEAEPAWTLLAGDLPLGTLTEASASGGDLDGDGYADLVFGVADWADPDADQGALVWVRGGVRDLDDDGASAATDCDDRDPSRYPGATEACNGIDDDCDGVVPADEADADGDEVRICQGDCDDTDVDRHPYAGEDCNALDDNCDGALGADEVDGDADGFRICDDDCDDADPAIHPGAVEVCGQVDEDCDSLVDDSDPDVVGVPEWHLDDDGDGYGDPALLGVSCVRLALGTAVEDATDCDDADPAVHPGADEVCNAGVDDDCDTLADADDDGLLDGVIGYVDSDGDGYGDPATEQLVCDLDGRIEDSTDCDDTDPDAWPGAPEVEGDGVDQDCDGIDATPPAPEPEPEPEPKGTTTPVEEERGCGCGHGGAAPSALWMVALALGRRRWTSRSPAS